MTDDERAAAKEMVSRIRAAYMALHRFGKEHPQLAETLLISETVKAVMHEYDALALRLEMAGYYR